jgi:hypothetical protein
MTDSQRRYPNGENWFPRPGRTTQGCPVASQIQGGHIDQYDGTSNPEEFIQVYQTVIEAAGGDDQVKANFLHTALTGAARSWLINLP